MKKKIKILLGLEKNELTDEIIDELKPTYDILLANDSEEAYQKIHVFDPDIAILDYSLSKIHPIELHEGIAMVHFHICVVICVNNENIRVAQRIWQKRAIDFILKPYDKERFVVDVNKIVRHLIDIKTIRRLEKKVQDLQEQIEKIKKYK